jgi:hypothetical protein
MCSEIVPLLIVYTKLGLTERSNQASSLIDANISTGNNATNTLFFDDIFPDINSISALVNIADTRNQSAVNAELSSESLVRFGDSIRLLFLEFSEFWMNANMSRNAVYLW